jgi:UPF0271 protein
MDLNSDLGEGFGAWRMGDDESLLAIVTSANIACGFHAGDPAIMHRTVRVAIERGVAIGAHVSYPDLRGFGRRHVDLPNEEIAADVLYQIGALEALAVSGGAHVAYVKPHGALYNEMAVDAALADTVVGAIVSYRDSLPLLSLPACEVTRSTERLGLPNVSEAFPDRAYEPDGRLTPRSRPGAVLHDPDEVARRAVQMATDGTVVATDGSIVRLDVQTLCVHGDGPAAVQSARAVRAALTAAGVKLAPFS